MKFDQHFKKHVLSKMYNYVLKEACALRNTDKSQLSVRTLAECMRPGQKRTFCSLGAPYISACR